MSVLSMNTHDLVFRGYVVTTFAMGFLMQIMPFPALHFLDDGLFLLLFITLLPHKPFSGFKLEPFVLLLPVFILCFALVAYFHGNSIEAIVLSLRQYKNVFLVFMLAGLHKDQLPFVHDVLKWSLILSIPFAIFQFLLGENADEVVGVFGDGASGTLSLIIIIYVSSEFAIRIRDKCSRIGWFWCLLLPVFINETKITFILLPLVILILFLLLGRLKIVDILIIAVMGVIFVALLDVLYDYLYNQSFTGYFKGETFELYFYNAGNYEWSDLGRFIRIIMAYDYVYYKGMLSYLFGDGLGASFVGVNSGIYGIAAEEFIGTGLNRGSRIQLYHFIIDFGILGSIFLISILIMNIVSIARQSIKSDADIYCVAIISVVLVGLVYQNIITNRVVALLLFYYMYTCQVAWGKYNK